MSRELLKQALDALESLQMEAKSRWCGLRIADEAIAALRTRLAQPEAEPYLCIKPACGPDCSGCNCAISPQTMRDYAVRYARLRAAPLDAIKSGGVFAGRTPENVVLNGDDLDAALDGATPQAIDGFGGNLDSAFAPAPAPVVPADMVMVPREPTMAMRLAAREVYEQPHEWALRTYRAMIAAAPAVQPLNREQQIAIREAHCNTASDEYFGARPAFNDFVFRRFYEAGFKDGWESGISTQGEPK